MRLAISNIAWDTREDEDIACLLRRHDVDAIDVASGKYFPEPCLATDDQVAQVRRWWGERGVEIIGMQALLFGTTGLNLFGPADVQAAMLRHLEVVCGIGAGLGATRLVFGSPRNRDRGDLDDRVAMEVAISFFRRLGDLARSRGVVICLEPNPPCYGANFMMTSADTARVVQQVDHPAIQMQLDTGALAINGEDPADVLERDWRLVGHIHASEPGLLPLGDGGADHAGTAAALNRSLPNQVVTIEMLATTGEPHPVSIDRALQLAIRHYRHDSGARQDRCRQ